MLDELHHALADAERRAEAGYAEHDPPELRGRLRHDLRLYSFPQMWGSTALGFGGMGGQAMTTAQTYIVVTDYGAAFVYFAGRFAYEADERQAMEWVRALRCPAVRDFRPAKTQPRTSGGES